MNWDLAGIKTFLGITDNSQDAAITALMPAALSMAERYCNRAFTYAREVTKFYNVSYKTLALARYPIAKVNSVSTEVGEYQVHKSAGIIVANGSFFAREVEVDYEGGFTVLPQDLVIALMHIFDQLWSSRMSTGGASAGGGAIKAIRAAGASVEYDTSGNSSSVHADSGLPTTAVNILDMYRREMC